MQAVRALGNIALDSPKCRDLVLGQGAMMPLLLQLNEHAKLSILRDATSTLWQFCQGYLQPQFEQVKLALSALRRLIYLDDGVVLMNVCGTLASLCKGTKDTVQLVIEAGVCQRLVEFLIHPSPFVLKSALRTIKHVVTKNDLQIQGIIDRVLPHLLSLLTHDQDVDIKEQACWTISNITAGNRDQIQAVIEAGLIAPLVNLLQTAEMDIKKRAARAIRNATFGGTTEQIKFLTSEGCMKPLCNLLVCPDPKIVTSCIKALGNILKVGEIKKNQGNPGDVNYFAQLVEEADGLGKIENLQSRDNNKIHQNVVKILETYWLEEYETDWIKDDDETLLEEN